MWFSWNPDARPWLWVILPLSNIFWDMSLACLQYLYSPLSWKQKIALGIIDFDCSSAWDNFQPCSDLKGKNGAMSAFDLSLLFERWITHLAMDTKHLTTHYTQGTIFKREKYMVYARWKLRQMRHRFAMHADEDNDDNDIIIIIPLCIHACLCMCT